jgi:hypothetical protein
LICAEPPSPLRLQALREIAETEGHGSEGRFVLVPPVGGDCPPPLDVRRREAFLASEEACAQVALQLCRMQKAFFGRTAPVRWLPEAPVAANTGVMYVAPESGKNIVANGDEQ